MSRSNGLWVDIILTHQNGKKDISDSLNWQALFNLKLQSLKVTLKTMKLLKNGRHSLAGKCQFPTM
jgi:hypothetical protein